MTEEKEGDAAALRYILAEDRYFEARCDANDADEARREAWEAFLTRKKEKNDRRRKAWEAFLTQKKKTKGKK